MSVYKWLKKQFKRSVCNDKTIVKYNFMLDILDHCISIDIYPLPPLPEPISRKHKFPDKRVKYPIN